MENIASRITFFDQSIRDASNVEIVVICDNSRLKVTDILKVKDATDSYKNKGVSYEFVVGDVCGRGESRVKARNILQKCYSYCLKSAKMKNCHSVALPCVRIRHEGYECGDSMWVAYRAVYDWMKNNSEYDISVAFYSSFPPCKAYYDIISRYYRDSEMAGIDTDVSKEVAIVLEGGGAKGAFHVGVWDTLCKYNLDKQIRGFSGTSIGAINEYIFLSTNTISEIETLWKNIGMSALLKDREQLELENTLKKIELIPDVCSKKDVFTTVTNTRKGDQRIYKESMADREYLSWRGRTLDEIRQISLASAAHIVIYNRKLVNGERYTDGGTIGAWANKRENPNVPIQPLYDIGYRKFIVVYSNPQKQELKQIENENERYGDAAFCRIFPTYQMGAVPLIDLQHTGERIELGQQVCEEMIRCLKKDTPTVEDLFEKAKLTKQGEIS